MIQAVTVTGLACIPSSEKWRSAGSGSRTAWSEVCAAAFLAPRSARPNCLFSSHPARCHDRDIIPRSRQTMKVTIKEWNAVAAWRWDMPDDDVCGICRNPYDSTCSKCKFPGDECPLCASTAL